MAHAAPSAPPSPEGVQTGELGRLKRDPGAFEDTAPLLAIKADDDERNPPTTGLTEQAIGRIKGTRRRLIPASEASRRHGSGGLAKLYARELGAGLAEVPRRADQ